MSLSQGLYQRQLQKLSPQQIQLMKLLQVPTALLEERIKEELEENPALEASDEEETEEFENDTTEEFEEEKDEFDLDGSESEYDNIDISDYVQDGDDDIADYKMKDDNYPEADDNKTIPHKVETGFNELMLEQLGQLNLNDHQQKVAEQIIGNLDDDGYLRREIGAIVDDLAFRQNVQTSEEEIESLVYKYSNLIHPACVPGTCRSVYSSS